MKKKIAAGLLALTAALPLAACSTANDADVVSQNIATAADNFEINRRIVIINNEAGGQEGQIIQLIEGWCNAEIDPDAIRTTCKVPGGYHKHINGRNSHTTFSIQQLDAANVSKDHYRVTYNPSTIIPDINIR
ncbi:hypothetical protein SEA_LASTRESORT_71 [Gordonia phage LastResort]|uniref:Uncharacterized protein n=1 Tax=Gordonia phage Soups TaxID=1838079 RepID=A0A160DG89_9CAUD|nr:site-specific recombination directionality factor RDF [Gordonia phage Soups]AXH47868.1 hypothetical protein SEA_LASTRESORT_71 [Gordonia phage LastResort]QDM56247.1 hypothetical protein SEA_REMO_71 [Gordonia phage ReMo]QLF84941.1 hypothetical protein SEA_EPSOCAMISIO_69 [Gordonia phage Epsocamisio]QZD98720.1 hypothetical protein SEA_LOOPER_72 [Gordonia phage Looper]UAJ15563.1 hypothetical protein SEA_BOOHOO_73 [Gordonia Phage Boohoo]UVD39819.1 hypothetical protein SEA_ANAYSIA_73 [Gordonia ph